MAKADFQISGLTLHGRHGALEAERSLGQHFIVDVALTADVGDALTSDKVEDTIHYGHVIKAVVATFETMTLAFFLTILALVSVLDLAFGKAVFAVFGGDTSKSAGK